jgi:hypothetical protein
MGAEGTRLQLVPYFDCTVLCGYLPPALRSAGFFGTALGLLEKRRQDAGKGDEETDDQETEAHCAPKCDVAGGAGLPRNIGVGDTAGDQSEEDEAGGEDVKIASHGMGLFYGAVVFAVREPIPDKKEPAL